MSEKWTKAKIEALLGEAETYTLEFKDAEWLNPRNPKLSKNISKHISAMANAAGGDFIIGIRESDGVADSVTPVDETEFSKERLQQIIDHNIQPTVRDLMIHRTEWDASKNEVVYVVEIPRSTQAHQANDFIFYQRRSGPTTEKMTASEIQDVNSRKVHPELEMSFYIELETYKLSRGRSFSSPNLWATVINTGHIYAQYVNTILKIPKYILPIPSRSDDYDPPLPRTPTFTVANNSRPEPEDYYNHDMLEEYFSFFRENTISDIGYSPILPQNKHSWSIRLREDFQDVIINHSIQIKWEIFADNAPPKSGFDQLADLIIEETEYEP